MSYIIRLAHIVVAHIRLIAQFRGFWFWLAVVCLIFCLTQVSSELTWAIFGLVSGVWLSKAWDESPVFIRSYGDPYYMVENSFFLFFQKRIILRDRISLSLFGGSRDKALVVYPFSIKCLCLFASSKIELSIDGAEVVKQKGHKTLYLKFSHSDLLYAFPDWETYLRFQLLAETKGKWVDNLQIGEEVYEHQIQMYLLGPVLTSAHLWSDLDIIKATENWRD